jgi:hypothetical protein
MVSSIYKYGWIKIVSVKYTPTDTTTLIMGIYACESNATGIEQYNTNKNINIYPNPASNMVQVTYAGNIINISVCDMLGKEVINTKETAIDVSSLQEGIYFVSVKTNEKALTKKIIIQR